MSDALKKLKPLERFSGRVDSYNKYRPSYTLEVIDFLEKQTGLKKDAVIADIGSGTGIFSKLLLDKGYKVLGVEPNAEIRSAGEKALKKYKQFTSINGSAEQTGLDNNSVDLITVAQAFHWMEPIKTKKEFLRILKKKGQVALLWNIRLTTTAFLKAFEALKVTYGTDYKATRMVKENNLEQFFAPGKSTFAAFPHFQLLDYEGLEGQLLSTSYVPLKGKEHDAMLGELKQLFEQYNEAGLVRIDYETKVYVG